MDELQNLNVVLLHSIGIFNFEISLGRATFGEILDVNTLGPNFGFNIRRAE